jgi:hypothetical protein
VGLLQTDSTEQIYEQTEKVVADLKNKWDQTEEKPAAIGLTVAAFVGLYVLNGVVNALDKIPVISGVLELVGIFVTSWFVYRYLVFGPGAHILTATAAYRVSFSCLLQPHHSLHACIPSCSPLSVFAPRTWASWFPAP